MAGDKRCGMIYRGCVDTTGLRRLPQTPEIVEAWDALFNRGLASRDNEAARHCWRVLQEAADRVESGLPEPSPEHSQALQQDTAGVAQVGRAPDL